MKITAICLPIALFLAACSTAAPAPVATTRTINTITIHSIPRSYIVHLPKSYDGQTKVPMVLLLHGATDSAAYAEKAYHFDEKADAEGFMLVLADALGDSHAWNALGDDTPESPNDDLTFLTTLLTRLPKTYAIDTHRVYVCGHSVGAIMTYRLAGLHPELIAAAGVVAGSVGDPPSIPEPSLPVPIIAFHGKLDTNIPYGEPVTGTVETAVAFWVKANHCNPSAKSDYPDPQVRRDVYTSSDPSHADFVLYTLANGNHMWPGGNLMPGKTEEPVQEISATNLMWDFFKQHSR